MLQISSRGGARERIGCIEIGDNVFIGTCVNILYDVKIGSNVIIGANSVVVSDVPDNSVAVGVPARIISNFDTFLKNKIKQQKDMPDLDPYRQRVSNELASAMWKKFRIKRCCNSKG